MIYLVVIPLLLAVVPWMAVRFVFTTARSRSATYEQALPYLLLAAFLWIAAFFVPNIPVSDQTDTFSQHAVGGIAATVLFLFAQRAYGWRFGEWWQPWLALFGFVSALGVCNELFEWFTTETGLIIIDSSDVWWDLVANTLGSIVAYGAYRLITRTARDTIGG